MKPVQDFVKAHFGVRYEDEILPWGPVADQHHTWQGATTHDITATYTFSEDINVEVPGMSQVQRVLLGNVAQEMIEGAINPFNRDLQQCAIYGMKAISGNSTYPVYTTYRTNYIHPASVKNMREKDDEQVAGGGIRGSVAYLSPVTPEMEDLNGLFVGVRNYHYHAPEFVKSMAHVTPSNLMNGIFMIPRSVCIAAYDENVFPVYRPAEPDLRECEEMDGKILFWYFVPLDHVLAWAFHADPLYRHQQHQNVIQYRVKRRKKNGGTVFKLAFLVCNSTLNRAKQSFMRSWAGRVHMSDLRSLDVEMVPIFNMAAKTAEKQQLIPKYGVHSGKVQLRVKIAYCLYERYTEQQLSMLCPTLSPHFPEFNNWTSRLLAPIDPDAE